jgi:hypothetical protein
VALISLLLFLACPNTVQDTAPDTGCESEGDIDDVRFRLVEETCDWYVLQCGMQDQRFLTQCSKTLGRELGRLVDDEEMCVDWCAARSYHQEVLSWDCSQAPVPEDEQDYPYEQVTQHFYTCDTPNYEPSGL